MNPRKSAITNFQEAIDSLQDSYNGCSWVGGKPASNFGKIQKLESMMKIGEIVKQIRALMIEELQHENNR